MIKILKETLSNYRFEILLGTLFLNIFDRAIFLNVHFYLEYIWPVNMLLIAIACYGIFRERSKILNHLRNGLGLISLFVPLFYLIFRGRLWFSECLYTFFIFYYSFILFEVLRQIARSKEVRLNVVFGSFCGYMLLVLISLNTFLLIEYNFPFSFHGVSSNNPSLIFNELTYFSFAILTSNGIGDIYPITPLSRLLVSFFGMMGQFYMVAVVGIVVSRFAKK
ncbi:MAG: hypothetical protein DI598_10980 [Pseudopedobacter saltans]|uniref:Potassium channel domain-containing protein n=1 Tax=Pseudopedobacter saltans TaxID=151895 RepID=A0A2W5GZY0_9SPHI|nr:MAG: hypothetical protein DI598_10980 [Pseudopedobacter saltans]